MSKRTKPDLYAFTIEKRGDDRPFYTRIGAAWAHERGGGYTIRLNALPIGREVVLFPPKDDDQAQEEGG